MADINITISGDKVTMIKALQALQFAKINVTGVKVGEGEHKAIKDDDKPYKLAEEFEGRYVGKSKE